MALEDLHNSRLNELHPDNMEDGDFVKKGDLAVILVRSVEHVLSLGSTFRVSVFWSYSASVPIVQSPGQRCFLYD